MHTRLLARAHALGLVERPQGEKEVSRAAWPGVGGTGPEKSTEDGGGMRVNPLTAEACKKETELRLKEKYNK